MEIYSVFTGLQCFKTISRSNDGAMNVSVCSLSVFVCVVCVNKLLGVNRGEQIPFVCVG